jgi:vancomycin permeability regulator SanA
LILLLVVVLAPATAALITWWRVERWGRRGAPAPADGILVFGAEAHLDRCSPELEVRVAHAARIYEQGYADVIVCSGGLTGPVSEPRVMRESLQRRGVPAPAILVDERGASTRGSLAAAAGHSPASWLFVSSPYHMHRIIREARRQGVEGVPCPAPDAPIMRNMRARLRQSAREVVAVWWYALSARRRSPQGVVGSMRSV